MESPRPSADLHKVPLLDLQRESREDEDRSAEDLDALEKQEGTPFLDGSTSKAPVPEQKAPDPVSSRTKYMHVALYFILNLSLTFYNKALLNGFHYPWTVTAIHSTSTALVCSALLWRGTFKLSSLAPKGHLILLAYSTLFTLNIAMSNISLDAVSIAFHQVMRATCPVVTVLLYLVLFRRFYSTPTYLSIIPIVAGAAIMTAGDYDFTLIGLVLTLLGVFLAALKTIVTNELLTGPLKLPPIEFLFRMSPLAAIQSLLCAALSGEASHIYSRALEHEFSKWFALALIGNGALACLLNISSLHTNKACGALTMTAAANVKQCFTVLFGILLFDVRVSLMNGIGIIVTLSGAAIYSKVELGNKKR